MPCVRRDALQEELYICHALSFVTALILPVAKCSKNKLRLDCGQSWVRSVEADREGSCRSVSWRLIVNSGF